MAQNTHIKSTRMEDYNVNCANITAPNHAFNNTINTLDEDAHIMRWLCPLEHQKRHQEIRNNRLDGVGDWLLETKEFREWRTRGSDVEADGEADGAVLFFPGNPGVGKTYLSSLVIDYLRDQDTAEDIAVACLYCDFLAQEDQTITNMMGEILKQLLLRGDIPQDIREAYRKGKKEVGGRGPRLPDLVGMLKSTIASLRQTFICIDALDECLPKHLPVLLRSLRDIVRDSPTTSIFLTGRPQVREDIKSCFDNAVVIPISPNMDDIRSYLEMRLANDIEPGAMNEELRADILRIIPERISEIFLLVSLGMDAILGGITVHQRKKKLEEMTQGNGLSDAYTATLTRVKAQKRNKSILGLKVLMWVSHSARPLRAEELCRAMGVEIGSTDFDIENVPTLRTLLGSALGLVTVESSSSTVRLIHFTLQEYLSSDPALLGSPHSEIAEVCLTYLNSQCIRDLSPTLCKCPSSIPLLEYASCYWGRHVGKEMTENVKTLALRLLDGFEAHISAQLVLWRYKNEGRGYKIPYKWGVRVTGFTGLHVAAFLGVEAVVAAVLGMKKWDVNGMDSTGSTALIWAARRGYERIVQLLLAQEDVNPNTSDTRYGKTPLSWAAENGHVGVVETLLAREDVNPNTPDTWEGLTPLCWAARNGYDSVVKTLLAREDVNPNTPDTKYRQTPLFWAARGGHDGVVQTLLAREDVNPNTPDAEYGQTPLCWAAENGDEAVVKAFLAQEDVHTDAPDNFNETPLSRALSGGYSQIVKMLQERTSRSSNPPHHGGQAVTPQSTRHGQEYAAGMLCSGSDLGPDVKDLEGPNVNLSTNPNKRRRILDCDE